MTFVLLVHGAVAALAALLGPRLGRRVMLVGAIAPATALVWVLVQLPLGPGGAIIETAEWVPALGLELGYRLDAFSALMAALIGGIGTLIFVYAWMYFGDREGLGRFAAYLVVFAAAMFGLVTADNLFLLFIFWELTSVTSYLLIGFENKSAPARAAALQALLVTGAGGLAMLGGIVLVGQEAGTYLLSAVLADPPTSSLAAAGVALLLLGAFTKSAQVPFHFWLPGAMAAPTPVSAYLHSATMVKAGVYLIARLAPAFAPHFEWWVPVVVGVGLATMVVGGWRALAQHDLKLLLAQGTVSQLGFMVVLVGVGIPELTFAGVAMILAHALFKAALFMVAGIVDHQARTRDVRRLTGVARAMPLTAGLALIAIASMAGVPPLLGFVTKEAALEGLVAGAAVWTTAGVVIGTTLTAAYGLRFLWSGFATKRPEDVPDPAGHDAAPPSAAFVTPPFLLVAATVVAGLVPAVADGAVVAAATSLDAGASAYHLALWHGLTPALLLSAIALTGGWLLWKRPLPGLRDLTRRAPDGTAVYSGTITGLNRLADRVTGAVQSGSLPVYMSVILATTVAAPGVLLVRHFALPDNLVLAESPLQAVAALLVMAAAVGAASAQRRLGAVLLLGAVGYGVAVLFIIQGAPDLALTQLLIETLALALFILVLSRLPARFELRQSRIRGMTRLGVAVGTGLMAGAFALWAASGRVAPSLSDEFMARALPEGGGRNVVNVILTDFRALDTLGEITVLTVAALGIMTLVGASVVGGRKGGSQ